MNDEELTEVFKIMLTADGGCSSCAKRLFAKLLLKYPDKIFIAGDVWKACFKEDYDEVYWLKQMDLEKEDD
jgi:hypothetical protein